MDDKTYHLRFGYLESLIRDDPDLVQDLEAIARLRGLTRGEYQEVLDQLADGVRRASDELTSDHAWCERLAALSWAGQTVVMVGDSITADLQSWARVLESAINRCEAKGRTHVVNLGVDGDTSAGVLARLPAILGHDPQYVVILIGTNDGQCHARNTVAWISDDETRRNLAAISATLRAAGITVAWVAPPRMHVGEIERHWYLGRLPIGWSTAQHESKRRLVLEQPGFTYDSERAVGHDRHLFLDGLHPNLEGHQRIARGLIDALHAWESQ